MSNGTDACAYPSDDSRGAIIYPKFLFVFFFALSVLLQPAGAQQQKDEKTDAESETPAELDAISVLGWRPSDTLGYLADTLSSATKTENRLLDTAMSISVITEDLIIDQNALSLDEALRNVAGVGVGPNAANVSVQEEFTIRGFESALVRLNGVQRRSTGPLSTANIESIEVIKGPMSVLYGDLSPGGFINVQTKRPGPEAAAEFRTSLSTVAPGRGTTAYGSMDLTGPVTKDGQWLYRLIASGQGGNQFIDTADREQYFVAPSLSFIGADRRLRTDLDLTYLRNDETFQFGIPARHRHLSREHRRRQGNGRLRCRASNPLPAERFDADRRGADLAPQRAFLDCASSVRHCWRTGCRRRHDPPQLQSAKLRDQRHPVRSQSHPRVRLGQYRVAAAGRLRRSAHRGRSLRSGLRQYHQLRSGQRFRARSVGAAAVGRQRSDLVLRPRGPDVRYRGRLRAGRILVDRPASPGRGPALQRARIHVCRYQRLHLYREAGQRRPESRAALQVGPGYVGLCQLQLFVRAVLQLRSGQRRAAGSRADRARPEARVVRRPRDADRVAVRADAEEPFHHRSRNGLQPPDRRGRIPRRGDRGARPRHPGADGLGQLLLPRQRNLEGQRRRPGQPPAERASGGSIHLAELRSRRAHRAAAYTERWLVLRGRAVHQCKQRPQAAGLRDRRCQRRLPLFRKRAAGRASCRRQEHFRSRVLRKRIRRRHRVSRPAANRVRTAGLRLLMNPAILPEASFVSEPDR